MHTLYRNRFQAASDLFSVVVWPMVVWLLMSSCAQGVSPKLGVPAVDRCGLSPVLEEFHQAADCPNSKTSECAWLPILELMVERKDAQALERLQDSFALPIEVARRLQAAVGLFLPLLLGGPCGGSSLEEALRPTFSSESFASLQHAEGLVLLFALFEVDPQAQAAVVQRIDAPYRDSVLLAAQSFASLAKQSETVKEGIQRQKELPFLGDGTLFPTLETWHPDLEALAPVMERVDETLLNLSTESVGSFHHQMKAEISRRRLLEEQGLLWVRVGWGLVIRGFTEDAAIALIRAERCFDDVSNLTLVARFTRTLSRSGLGLIFEAIGWTEEGRRIQNSLGQGAETSLERWLADALRDAPISLEQAQAANALAGKKLQKFMELVLSGEIDPQEIKAMEHAIFIAVPGLAASEVPSNPASDESAVPDFLNLLGHLVTGELEQTLESWRSLQRDTGRYDLILWPSLVTTLALRRGQLDLAIRSWDEAIAYLEEAVLSIQVDDFARAVIDEISAPIYGLGVDMQFLADRPEEAFGYAERGRSFTLRMRAGQALSLSGSLSSQEEIEAEQAVVGLVRAEGRMDGSDRQDLWERFIALRRERRLLDPRPGSYSADQPYALAEVRQALQPGEVLLTYFSGKDVMWLWVVRPDGLETAALPWAPNDIATVTCLLSTIQGRRIAARSEDKAMTRGGQPLTGCLDGEWETEPAGRLYDLLMAPAAEHFEATDDRLIVVPHGRLHHVPWAALRQADDSPLMMDFEISVSPSADFFVRQRLPELRN